MKVIKQSVLSLAAALVIAAPSLAADINVSVDQNQGTLTLTNALQQAVHVMSLGSGPASVGMSVDLPAGESRTVKYRGALPAVAFARCLSAQGVKLTDRTPTAQGFYNLSVSIR